MTMDTAITVFTMFDILTMEHLSLNGQSPLVTKYQNEYLSEQRKKARTRQYDAYGPPNNPTSVNVHLTIETINNVDELYQTMDITSTILFIWKDDRLKFNREKYGNLSGIFTRLHSLRAMNAIWFPKIYSNINRSQINKFLLYGFQVNCYIKEDGTVKAWVRRRMTHSCVFDYGQYPNDLHSCDIYFFTQNSANVMSFHNKSGADLSSALHHHPHYKQFRVDHINSKVEQHFIRFNAKSQFILQRSLFHAQIFIQRRNLFYTATFSTPIFLSVMIFIIVIHLPFLLFSLGMALNTIYLTLQVVFMAKSLPIDLESNPNIMKIALVLYVHILLMLIWKWWPANLQKQFDTNSKGISKEEILIKRLDLFLRIFTTISACFYCYYIFSY